MHVTVVGAGVSGLTTAAALVEAGWSVDIVARERHPDTVSVVAAAIWTTTTAEPQVRVRQWALTTRERFATIAADSSSGIAPLMQREFERVDPGPLWWESTPFVRRLGDHELPPEYAAGFEIDGFIVEPPIYLDWLTSRLVDQGVTITTNAVTSLEDLEADVIVNCAGLAARDLVGDDTMFPIRGQVVAVANPGINEGVSDESDADRVAYVYPRSNEVILGGARQIGNEQMACQTTTSPLASCLTEHGLIRASLTSKSWMSGLACGQADLKFVSRQVCWVTAGRLCTTTAIAAQVFCSRGAAHSTWSTSSPLRSSTARCRGTDASNVVRSNELFGRDENRLELGP